MKEVDIIFLRKTTPCGAKPWTRQVEDNALKTCRSVPHPYLCLGAGKMGGVCLSFVHPRMNVHQRLLDTSECRRLLGMSKLTRATGRCVSIEIWFQHILTDHIYKENFKKLNFIYALMISIACKIIYKS